MFSALTTINEYNPIKALFLKEFWDNRRAILVTPMVITGLFIFFGLIAMVTGNGMMIDGASLNDHISNAQDLGGEQSYIMTGVLMFSPMILIISIGFSMVFTALSVLYDERKNKSILFWKSMPVSDTQEVLVKLATVIVVTPLVAIPFAFIIQIFTALTMGTMVAINTDFSAWDVVFSNIDYLAIIANDFIPIFVFILWTLPIIAWFMFVSSFSRRSPFLLAFIVPALIVAAEAIFFNSSILIRAIASRFSYLGRYSDRYEIEDGNILEGIFSLLGSFGEPSFWYGVVIAGLMIVGCIQLRKRNSIT